MKILLKILICYLFNTAFGQNCKFDDFTKYTHEKSKRWSNNENIGRWISCFKIEMSF